MTIERITEFAPSDRYIYDFVLCMLIERNRSAVGSG